MINDYKIYEGVPNINFEDIPRDNYSDALNIPELDSSITPNLNNSLINVRWVINFEAEVNTTFKVVRFIGSNGYVIANNSTAEESGVATSSYDNSNGHSPHQLTLEVFDEPNVTSEVIYKVYVVGSASNSNTRWFALNGSGTQDNDIGSNTDYDEKLISSVFAIEYDQHNVGGGGSTNTGGRGSGTLLFAPSSSSSPWNISADSISYNTSNNTFAIKDYDDPNITFSKTEFPNPNGIGLYLAGSSGHVDNLKIPHIYTSFPDYPGLSRLNFLCQSHFIWYNHANVNHDNNSGAHTEIMRLKSNGNLGIGTNSPSTLLVVGEDGGGHPTNTPGIHMKSIVGQTNKCYVVGQDTTHNVHLSYHPNTTVSNGYGILSCYGGSNNLAIQHDGGSVGIGTTSPDSNIKLQLESSHNDGCRLKLRSTGSRGWMAAVIDLTDATGTKNLFFANKNGGLTLRPVNGKNVILCDKNSAGGSFTSGGNVGIGTTNPGARLDVNGSTHLDYMETSSWVYIKGATGRWPLPSTSGYRWSKTWSRTGPTWQDSYPIALRIDSGSIYSQNDPVLHTNSDIRIKKDIEEVPDNLSLEMVRNIPCKYYKYIDEGRNIKNNDTKIIGFIAQEVKEVFPLAVDLVNDFEPNENRLLENISWEKIIDNSNNVCKYKLISDLQDVSGIKYKFYMVNDPSGNVRNKKRSHWK